MNQPEKEYGWITAFKPEEIKALGNANTTDEMWISEKWAPCRWVNEFRPYNCVQFYPIRRRINPGHGYEIVPKEEDIQEDYDVTGDGLNWGQIRSDLVGETVEEALDRHSNILAIRRKLPVAQPAASPQAAPWIKFSERRPSEQDFPIECCNMKNPPEVRCIWRFERFEFPKGSIHTHWRKADNTFPQPEKSEGELAFEKLFGPISEHKSNWTGWEAALEWRGKEGK